MSLSRSLAASSRSNANTFVTLRWTRAAIAMISADPISEIRNVTSSCAPRITQGRAAEARSRRNTPSSR